MDPELKDSTKENYVACVRLTKGLIVAGRKLGENLQAMYKYIPATEDIAADETNWLNLIQKEYGIEPDIALIFADFSLMDEVQQAVALPTQTMPLLDALTLLTYLTPCGVAEDPADCLLV